MTRPKQVQKKTLRNYWENFFCNNALFYMQGVGIFTEITVHQEIDIKIELCATYENVQGGTPFSHHGQAGASADTSILQRLGILERPPKLDIVA